MDVTSSQITAATPPVAASGSAWARSVVIYGGIGLLVCFWGLGSTDVVSMEGIVADQARHMLRTGDYAVPHLYGEPYTYKPPLVAWLVAGSFKLTGSQSEWSLRLPNALCGLLMGLAVLVLIGRAIDPKTGGTCALAVITAVYVVQKLHIAEFDMPLAAGVGIAVAAACYNLSAPAPVRALWLVGYVALAGGVLAKGAPALMLYLPGLLGAAVVTWRWRRLFTFSHLASVLLCAVLVSLWVWRAYAAMGPGLVDHPLIEAYTRGLGWGSDEILLSLLKPLIVGAIFLPWTFLIPLTWKRRWWQGLDDTTRRMEAASGAFLALGIAVSMSVPTDDVRYLLPLCVPAGIVSGLAGRAVITRRDDAEPVSGEASPEPVSKSELPQTELPQTGLPQTERRQAERRTLSWVLRGMLIAALCHWAVYVFIVKPRRVEGRSLRPAAELFAPHIPPEATVRTDVGDSYSSLFFYLDRPVRDVSLFSDHLKPGTFLVLPEDQLADLESRQDLTYAILERAPNDPQDLILARIQPPQ